MRNLKLIVQYDGANFSGFAKQPGRRTVQDELEKAVRELFGKKIKVFGASRTDSGVHAVGQVVNFKVKHPIPTSNVRKALGAFLPDDIGIVKVEAVKANFSARFSAKSKEYEYLIHNGDKSVCPFHKFIWQVKPRLNILKMRKAAKYLTGKHDFSSFCASGSDDINFVRVIHKLVISHSSLVIWGSKLPVISVRIRGNAFLYRMVRNMVGTLVEVGWGRFKAEDAKGILLAHDRKKAGRCAPARGLCLIRANY